MKRETLKLTLGASPGMLTVVLTGSDAQLQCVRQAVLAAASKAKEMEGKEPKPCGCSGS